MFKQSVFKHVRKRGEVVDRPACSHERANTAAVVVVVERQLQEFITAAPRLYVAANRRRAEGFFVPSGDPLQITLSISTSSEDNLQQLGFVNNSHNNNNQINRVRLFWENWFQKSRFYS